MATSKLFNPLVKDFRNDMFQGAQSAPDAKMLDGTTSGGEACNPLRLSPVHQVKSMKLTDKQIKSEPQDTFDY